MRKNITVEVGVHWPDGTESETLDYDTEIIVKKALAQDDRIVSVTRVDERTTLLERRYPE